MSGKFLLRQNEASEMAREIHIDELRELLKEIQENTQWQIFDMIRNIQMDIAKSYSVSKENPKSSVFMYGRTSSISMTFRTKEKEARLQIPKDIVISPKN